MVLFKLETRAISSKIRLRRRELQRRQDDNGSRFVYLVQVYSYDLQSGTNRRGMTVNTLVKVTERLCQSVWDLSSSGTS